MSYIFGPVPSRRLGRSLGVDVVPYKTCTYDCIYCQLGRTTCRTTEQKAWVPLQDVLTELKDKLTDRPDYITLSGSGEPTLYSQLDKLINSIKYITNIPVAVLTNGSLLWQAEVRSHLMNADLVIPSLDAADEMRFRYINRPHNSISFEKMLSGLITFREYFQGQYWLEIFLLAGYTAIEAEVKKLAQCVDSIRPDRVQLNTVTRPPAESFAEAISREHMAELATMFNPPAEVIADFHGIHDKAEFSVGREEILNMLQRRPCSIDDITDGLGMHRNEVLKYVEDLSAAKQVEQARIEGKCLYRAVNGDR